MFATADGTARYADRFPQFRAAGFFRSVLDLHGSSLGIGTYLGYASDAADSAYIEALIAAGENGINFFDTASNYRGGRSEVCIGTALKRLQRDEIVVCTKAGFITKGLTPASMRAEDVVAGMHSMAPDFLADQIERSRVNLGVDTIDVHYLHNPETQLGFLTRPQFDDRIRAAFTELERQAEARNIRWYGVATWEGLRTKGALSLPRLYELATEVGGPEHHFRFIQLPFNLQMVEAYIERPESVLETAAHLGIVAVASASLLQAHVLKQMPPAISNHLGLTTDAQRAIQFTRSTPGISVALVGMGQPAHVVENLGIAPVPPLARAEYERLYQ